jgi:hypothetical protein
VVSAGPAAAHVKWFCGAIDGSIPPQGLDEVLTPTLLLIGASFTLLVASGALADGVLSRRWPSRSTRVRRGACVEDAVMRIGMAVYMLLLGVGRGTISTAAGAASILTPELLHRTPLIGWLQFAIAAALVFRRTCPLAGLGVATLYGIGVVRYGVFHMADYVFFLGIAFHLALGSPFGDARPRLQGWRVPVMGGALGFSLMWTAVEKLLYPAWTAIVLAAHPATAFGFPIPFVTETAGFVEFSLAFYLVVGRFLLRLDAAVIILVLLAAVPEFGVVDEIGHIPIIAVLLVLVLHGATALQATAWPPHRGPLGAAWRVMTLYVGTFSVMVAMYYGLQRLAP